MLETSSGKLSNWNDITSRQSTQNKHIPHWEPHYSSQQDPKYCQSDGCSLLFFNQHFNKEKRAVHLILRGQHSLFHLQPLLDHACDSNLTCWSAEKLLKGTTAGQFKTISGPRTFVSSRRHCLPKDTFSYNDFNPWRISLIVVYDLICEKNSFLVPALRCLWGPHWILTYFVIFILCQSAFQVITDRL